MKIFECRGKDDGFVTGFAYWNDGLRKLTKHSNSKRHQEAIVAVAGLNSAQKVDDMLDKHVMTSKQDNRYMLINVVQVIKFLGRQGLAFRGKLTLYWDFHNITL